MNETDAKLADAIQWAWQNLYNLVLEAEAAGLKVHVYVPEDTYDGAKALCDGDIEVTRQYDIEVAVAIRVKAEAKEAAV